MPELFGGVSEGNLTTTDPCSRYSASTNATLVANRRASGVPAGYVQFGTSIPTTVGGNQNLKAESLKSWTLGTVVQPRSIIPGLSLIADWFDMDITGQSGRSRGRPSWRSAMPVRTSPARSVVTSPAAR